MERGIADDVAFLISKGHLEREVGDYALDTFREYVAGARRLEARGRQRLVADTAAAIAGVLAKKGQLQEYLDSLAMK